ncbi:hypothetical protein J7384_08345 [Endozoicomonas sp. G2_1]|uniref:hypothetical protein n=1 Tax=Endozoicomonas sp. G2_1 TaxID=2821091 RepID=UPI001ADA0ABF|nr:hypothetical protein [Endozoicomonas sp. G2_1]MBO9490368.1 hypothetical protein [Endozoicomonas sp. G2_1]
MNFNQILQIWLKGELLQGKVMIIVGVLLLLAAIAIFRNQNELLRGTLLPIGFLITVLIGYGGYILQSRPAHVAQSEALYHSSPIQAVAREIDKHTSDNQIGNTLLKIYPVLAIIAIVVLMWLPSGSYRGIALGFTFVFLSALIIDNGFVTRSNAVIQAISKL